MATQLSAAIDLDTDISNLGQNVLSELPPMSVIPEYDAFQQLIAVGVFGSDPGQFDYPQGVSIQDTGHIYVADWGNSRIQIFSETGEHIKQFGDVELSNPCGILIHQDDVYVTDYGHNSIFRFSLPDLTLIKQVGKGSEFEYFSSPSQIALSPDHQIYVADSNNDRLQIFNRDLEFKGSLEHNSMTCPFDIKFSMNEMFVLSRDDNPCVHIFTHSGKKMRSIITRSDPMQVEMAFFFLLDAHGNIVISDYSADQIKVFSTEGELLHIIGENGHAPGMFYHLTGIAILKQNKLVCVSDNFHTDLCIFSAY